MAGRGSGKVVHLNTPLATPSGWSTMGDIQVGQHVFDEQGHPCTVLAKYHPDEPTQYRMTFSDGSYIDTGADHQWITWTHAERKALLRSRYDTHTQFPLDWPTWRSQYDYKGRGHPVKTPLGPRVRTTEEVRETLTYSVRGDTNHCIPACQPLHCPEVSLPIPPYTLGVWLGDGSACDGTITSHEDDQKWMREQIEADGFPTTDRSDAQNFGTKGLTTRLTQHGLLNNKHVPSLYLRASYEQRVALLHGLMDTDGNNERGSSVSFVNTNKRLIDAVEELVHSVGLVCRVTTGIGKLYGVPHKRFWRVNFTTTDFVPFRMPRKATRHIVRATQKQVLRNRHRMIVSIEPIPCVPMACITVDSPHSLYLVGTQMIPTHNTRSGAEWVRDQVENKGVMRVGLIGPTAADVRDVMACGESGIIACSTDDFLPKYEPSKRRLLWPTGAIATMFSAEEPERLRGPQHEKIWADELAAWKAPETFDMGVFGLRLGPHPQMVITTTPKPTPFVKRIMKLKSLVRTSGSMLDNKDNLPDSFINAIMERYQGTRLGKQEIEGLYLDKIDGALFSEEHILRRDGPQPLAAYERICIAVDPAVSAGEGSDETGIIVCGSYNDGKNADVLEDKSGHYKPNEWADIVVRLFTYWKASKVVGEVNNGGDLVEHTLRHATGGQYIPFLKLHSSRGKRLRAEPVSALYEQRRVFHTRYFEQLEEQMVTFNPEALAKKGESPDRVDALVFCLTWLIIDRRHARARFLYG